MPNRAGQDLQAIITEAEENDLVARFRQEDKALIRQIRLLHTQLSNAPREVQLKAFLEKFRLQKDNANGIGQSRITPIALFGGTGWRLRELDVGMGRMG